MRLQRTALANIDSYHKVRTLKDLMVPHGNHLETLQGNRQNQHRICINNQWRLCFRWENGDAFEVEIIDYH